MSHKFFFLFCVSKGSVFSEFGWERERPFSFSTPLHSSFSGFIKNSFISFYAEIHQRSMQRVSLSSERFSIFLFVIQRDVIVLLLRLCLLFSYVKGCVALWADVALVETKCQTLMSKIDVQRSCFH